MDTHTHTHTETCWSFSNLCWSNLHTTTELLLKWIVNLKLNLRDWCFHAFNTQIPNCVTDVFTNDRNSQTPRESFRTLGSSGSSCNWAVCSLTSCQSVRCHCASLSSTCRPGCSCWPVCEPVGPSDSFWSESSSRSSSTSPDWRWICLVTEWDMIKI